MTILRFALFSTVVALAGVGCKGSNRDKAATENKPVDPAGTTIPAAPADPNGGAARETAPTNSPARTNARNATGDGDTVDRAPAGATGPSGATTIPSGTILPPSDAPGVRPDGGVGAVTR
jgi:hypothetical protein